MSVSLDTINQTSLVPQTLLGLSSSNQSININSTDGIVFKDATLNLTASLSWDGIITDKPTGFDILSPLNMNTNDINNVNSLNSTAGGNDLTISSSKVMNMTSTDDFNITSDINFIVNSSASVILNGNGTYINTIGGGGGDGQITANTFNGYLNGTADLANTASFAYSAGSATNSNNILITSDNTSGTYYIPFSKSSGTGYKGLFQDDTTTALSYNPNTSTLSATTFSGNLNGTANSATNSSNSTIIAGNNFSGSNWFPCVVNSSTAGNYNLTSYSNLSYIPNTNTFSCNISGNSSTATNATNAINCSTTSTTTAGTYYPVFVSSNITGNYPNLVGVMTYNPSTNTITANTFNGALSGTATNATNVAITDDNTNATYYPVFVSNNTGNLPLKVDKTTNPLSYNPSTGVLTSTTFSGLLDTGGLVYLSTGSQAITGSASATNISLTSIFNSTYKNYRIVLYPTTQVSFTAYPNYALTAFLGTGTLPTTASLYGFEIVSTATSVVSPVYTASATISSAPLVLAVSQLTNHQTIIEVENVGFTATTTQSIGLKCKSIYSNPAVSGASDRTISAVNISGSTITGLTLQQSSISSPNNMTIGWTIYGYK
jgi:hypothetical protein